MKLGNVCLHRIELLRDVVICSSVVSMLRHPVNVNADVCATFLELT